MSKLNTDSKQAIIGLRRKNISRIRIGELLYTMVIEKRKELYGVKNICSMLKMDLDTFNKHIGFKIVPQGHRQESVLVLNDNDINLIKKTKKIFNELLICTPAEQKIIQYVFLYLSKHEG